MKTKLKKLFTRNGFTLVELIVVIVILAILAVIAFMNISKWIGKSANTRTASDLGTINRSLHSHFAQNGKYPESSNSFQILSNTGLLLANQGIFDENVVKEIGNFGKVPKDPTANNYYLYTKIVNPSGGFEVGGILENPEISVIVDSIYAQNNIPYVVTNYHGKYYDSNNLPIFPKPISLINSQIGNFIDKQTLGENGKINIDINNLTGISGGGFSADGTYIGGEYGDYIIPTYGYKSTDTVAEFSTGVVTPALPNTITNVESSISSNSSTSSSSTPSIINGECGSDHMQRVGTPINLCNNGTQTSVDYNTGSGLFTWNCNGINGGNNVSCKAYDNKTILLVHFDGQNNSTNITDSIGKTITRYGETSIKTGAGLFKIGNGAGYFDGAGDYITFDDSTDFDIGNEDFTIDFWFKTNSTVQDYIFARTTGNYIDYGMDVNGGGTAGTIRFLGSDSNDNAYQILIESSVSVNNNARHHIAGVRRGSSFYLYIDGVLRGTDSTATCNLVDSSAKLSIGKDLYTPEQNRFIIGYVDEFRISKGIARWTSNFNANLPTLPY